MTQTMKLKDCATIIAGQSPKSDYYNTEGDGLPFFQGKSDFGELYPKIRVFCSEPIKIAEKDDILLSVRAPVGPTNLAPAKVCIGRGLSAIRPNEKLDLKYLLWFFRYYEAQLSSQGTGTTFKAINQNVLKNIDIPVPTINEQHSIVARIDELFSDLGKGVETLQTIKQQLAVYRQAALKEAFGQHYLTVKISDVCSEIVDCPHSTPKWVDTGYVCLRTTNFKRGFLDLTEPNYVSQDTFNTRNKRLIPKSGDVLYSREGSILGIACIIPAGITPCLGQRMMLLRVSDKLNNRFLMHYLNSPMVTNHVITTKGGTGSPHINVGDIKNFYIPLPNIKQQERIVASLDAHLSVCDSIEQTVDTALSQAEAMRQSILKKAFEGGFSE